MGRVEHPQEIEGAGLISRRRAVVECGQDALGEAAAGLRVAGFEAGTVVVGFVAIISAVTGLTYLMDIALVWALVSFVGTLALAKYLVGKRLNE